MYIDYIYELIEMETKGLDSIYEDYIIHLVGVKGLEALQLCKLVESCGVVNGRKLYVLCEKNW